MKATASIIGATGFTGALLTELLSRHPVALTVEAHYRVGGVGSSLSTFRSTPMAVSAENGGLPVSIV